MYKSGKIKFDNNMGMVSLKRDMARVVGEVVELMIIIMWGKSLCLLWQGLW